MVVRTAVVAFALAGCANDIDPPWQLDHDRIVAVRATPPHVRAGEAAQLDALLAHAGGPTTVATPLLATAAGAPGDLYLAVHYSFDHWQVDGQPDSALAPARAADGLAADAPVPLVVTMRFQLAPDVARAATKTVWLGDHADNPPPPAITIAGAPAPDGELVVPAAEDVALAVDVDPDWGVQWLSSCGTLHDDDLPRARLHVAPADPHSGELGVVVRDLAGGVAWRTWTIRAAGS